MKVLKIVNKNKIKEFKKDGKESAKRYQVTYFLVTDNNKYIAIKPVFVNEYQLLDFVSETKVIAKKDSDDNKDLPF